MAYLDINGNYYEGDLADIRDLEVPTRPTPYHMFNSKLRQWVLDENKVMTLKKQVLANLDEELRVKLLLMNLNEDEKNALRNVYEDKVKELSNCNDPLVLQNFKL